MGPLDKDVVRPNGLKAAGDKLELELRSHWYRSLPLSSLAVVDIAIDDQPVAAEKLSFRYEGKRYTFNELPDQFNEWWYITDPITIEIPHADARAGTEHKVHVDLGLSIPYIIVGPPQAKTPLLAASVTDKTLVCN